MKKLIALFVIMGLSFLFPQELIRKQITFLTGADCKNFSSLDPFNYNKKFVFEADFGTKTNIFVGHYDMEADSFVVDLNVTDNNYQNTNPSLKYYSGDTLLIIYETNEKGNLDIAYKLYANNYLSETYFLTNDLNDEYNPKPAKLMELGSDPSNGYVAYQVNSLDGIGISVKKCFSPEPATVIFSSTNANFFSNLTFITRYNKFMLAATVDSSDGSHYIVYRETANGIWQPTKALLKGEVSNLLFSASFYYGNTLSYSKIDSVNGKSNIFWIDADSPENIYKLYQEAPYDVFDMHTNHSYIIADQLPPMPFAFKSLRNDSLFVSVSKNLIIVYFNPLDTLIYTKVRTTSLDVARFHFEVEGEVFYSVWQDSVGDHIQLFGWKNYNPIGALKDNVNPQSFSLEQNYPNPFNPTTTVTYNLKKSAHVKLSVYSLLGEVVGVPVNEYQSAGEHKVLFNAKNLPSGVYFYELSAEGSKTVKKMIFIK